MQRVLMGFPSPHLCTRLEIPSNLVLLCYAAYAQMLLVLILRGTPWHAISHAQKVATGQAGQFLSALPREYISAICETMRGHESVNGTV